MRILHVMAGLGAASGVANIARRFARAQERRGDSAVLLAPAFKWNPICFGLVFAIKAWREARTADEIWVHCSWTFPVWYGAWLARLFGNRLVVVPEGSFDPKRLDNHARWKKRLVAPLDRWVLRRADETLALCPDELQWVRSFEPTARVRLERVPLFMEEEQDHRPLPFSDSSLHVLFLGRAEDPLKGVEFLERAVRVANEEVRMRNDECRKVEFVVVKGGEAPFRKTKDALAWARETGLIGRMTAAETGGKGIVTISAESIRETLNPRQREKSASDKVHFAALTKLRELIRESKILEVHPDWHKDESGRRVPTAGANPDISICIAYAAFEFCGALYRVRLALKRYAQTGTSKAYAYRVNEIEVVSGTLGGKIAPATYPTDTASICASILLHGAVNVNGVPLDIQSKSGVEAEQRKVELRIVSDHFGEKLEGDWSWCDVLCLPTLSENYGLVVAEALERGKRVIVTDGATAWDPAGEDVWWGERLVYLRGYRSGTDEDRVGLLQEALMALARE